MKKARWLAGRWRTREVLTSALQAYTPSVDISRVHKNRTCPKFAVPRTGDSMVCCARLLKTGLTH